jgi:hypothetical protein
MAGLRFVLRRLGSAFWNSVSWTVRSWRTILVCLVIGNLLLIADHEAVEGRLMRQSKPKSDSSRRTITLPAFVVTAIREVLELRPRRRARRTGVPVDQGHSPLHRPRSRPAA